MRLSYFAKKLHFLRSKDCVKGTLWSDVRCLQGGRPEGAVASVLLASRAGDAVSSGQGLDPFGEDRPLVDGLLALVQVTR